MRVFIAATMSDLASSSLSATHGHARTFALEKEVVDDEEMLDAMAMMAAADDSLRLILASDDASPRRVVIAVDVRAKDQTIRDLPTEVEILDDLAWDDVVAIFIDEETSVGAVEAARRGGDAEFDAVADLDMLWYHPSERLSLV